MTAFSSVLDQEFSPENVDQILGGATGSYCEGIAIQSGSLKQAAWRHFRFPLGADQRGL